MRKIFLVFGLLVMMFSASSAFADGTLQECLRLADKIYLQMDTAVNYRDMAENARLFGNNLQAKVFDMQAEQTWNAHWNNADRYNELNCNEVIAKASGGGGASYPKDQDSDPREP